MDVFVIATIFDRACINLLMIHRLPHQRGTARVFTVFLGPQIDIPLSDGSNIFRESATYTEKNYQVTLIEIMIS
jgi:hypothetical protein